jgi:hypothetical protein
MMVAGLGSVASGPAEGASAGACVVVMSFSLIGRLEPILRDGDRRGNPRCKGNPAERVPEIWEWFRLEGALTIGA